MDETLRSKIQHLVNLVPKPKPPADAQAKNQEVRRTASSGPTEQDVLESWEDDDCDSQPSLINVVSPPRNVGAARDCTEASASTMTFARPTRTGVTMKEEFAHRRQMPAYQLMLETRSALPMYAFREQLLQAVRENPITILCAEVSL